MKRALCAFAMIVFSTAALATATPPAAGKDAPKLLGSFDSWRAYSFYDKDEKVCFMSAQPKSQKGKFKKRGEVFFFVTHWSASGAKNVVSISNGYTFKTDSQVTVKIDGRTFPFSTQGEMAWTRDPSTDDSIVDAMQKGAHLTVEGTSKFGTETVDTYALKGSGAAYKAVTTACPLKVTQETPAAPAPTKK